MDLALAALLAACVSNLAATMSLLLERDADESNCVLKARAI